MTAIKSLSDGRHSIHSWFTSLRKHFLCIVFLTHDLLEFLVVLFRELDVFSISITSQLWLSSYFKCFIEKMPGSFSVKPLRCIKNDHMSYKLFSHCLKRKEKLNIQDCHVNNNSFPQFNRRISVLFTKLYLPFNVNSLLIFTSTQVTMWHLVGNYRRD